MRLPLLILRHPQWKTDNIDPLEMVVIWAKVIETLSGFLDDDLVGPVLQEKTW
jgi:hypothetical protein